MLMEEGMAVPDVGQGPSSGEREPTGRKNPTVGAVPVMSMTAVGDVIAHRYRLVNKVAVGGMGLVWEASDELLLRRVAVKQLLTQPGLAESELVIARNRVIREARITARLHHPNAVTLYDVVDHAGHPCLIMQFVPSVSLSGLLQQHGSLPPTVVARIGADVASALVAAHAVGIVHRDVKPGNVLIADDGSAKLTDFGISHAVGDITLTATGMVSGTPAYLAPEVARGAESGCPADVFSLGSTLYAALEGSPPFGVDSNPMAVLHRVGSGRIDPPRRSGPLTPLLLRMLAPEPAARPAMFEVAQALAGRPIEVRTLHDVPPTAVISAQTDHETRPGGGTAEPQVLAAPADTGAPPAASTARRRPRGAVLIVVAVVIAAVTLVGFVLFREIHTPQAAVATPSEPSRLTGLSAPSAIESAPETSPPDIARVSSNPSPTAASSIPGTSPSESPPAIDGPPAAGPEPTPAAEPTTAEPATPESTAPGATQPQETTPTSLPTAAELAAAVTEYYALMPANTDEGWARLTPRFQTGIAQDRGYYESFWGGVDRVLVIDVSGDPPNHAEATISYYFADGRVSVERTTYQLIQDGGTLKIDNSEVLSSR
jgi:serine/threonine protein kinase